MNENKVQLVDISLLKPYEKNAKIHDSKQVKKIAESIKRFGWRGNPVIVDKDYVIISGHGRRLAALSLGMKEVPTVIETDMTAEQARAFRLADNRVAISDIDSDLFEEELMEFPDLMDELDGIFDKKEIDFTLTDIMQVDESEFVDDLDEVIQAQQEQVEDSLKKSEKKKISLKKAMGFDSVNGKDAVYATRFIAYMEAQTGLKYEDAFIEFAKRTLENAE